MIGYKGMSKDMTCRGMKYEVGGTYKVDGDIELCKNGLHFCENLFDVFRFYSREEDNRFFLVECMGTIKTDGRKSVASEMRIIRELTPVEINWNFYSGYNYGYGNDYGDGCDDGYGDGNGNGYGDGYNYGNGNGNGYGDGYGTIMKILCKAS